MSFIAYKGFDKDLTCRGFQYEVGKTYSLEDKPKICEKGFHCCAKLSDVFSYYPAYTWRQSVDGFNISFVTERTSNRFCLVEVLGDVDFEGLYSSKVATNKIKILQELAFEDLAFFIEDEKEEAHKYWVRLEGDVDMLRQCMR